ncbi:MAG: hypothetical protein IKN72_00820 [Clostridia bacterium]|nr:hypothetical protein [Clostridia bacterium]
MTAKDARGQVAALLTEWCDALVRLQVNQPGCDRLDGGILCPACGCIHGRCHEAVYPLLCAARLTGNETYLTAANRLFAWGQTMRCADGGVRNDYKSEWKGVTVFAAVALHDALRFHGDLLTQKVRAEWEACLSDMGAWLFRNLTERSSAYLNYLAANACAMALLGAYFSRDDYTALAKRLAAYCLTHVTETGLLYGEGHPKDAVSPKGCRAIDVGGYNVEETLPCLCRYACAVGDARALDVCRDLWRAHLEWMLPDGAWDDSTGTRSFKWTYWGSRTADGCQAALFDLGKTDVVFAEAAWRNFELLRRCTHDGLLAGGPDCHLGGEPTCVHHTFCHAKTLAAAIDGGIPAFARVCLPSDQPAPIKRYPELDTFRAACGKWRMDVCGSDFAYSGAGHATGGSITLLWHETAGPLIAVGMLDNTLREPHNQQLSVHPQLWRSGCPRLETADGGERYGQHRCAAVRLTSEMLPAGPSIRADAFLCGKDGLQLPGGACSLVYRLTEDALFISGFVDAALADRVCYVLPLIGSRAAVEVPEGALLCPPETMFNLCPGFLGRAFRVRPNRDGRFEIRLFVNP